MTEQRPYSPSFNNESQLPDREVAPQIEQALNFFRTALKDFISAYPEEGSLIRKAIEKSQPNATLYAILEQVAAFILASDLTHTKLSRPPRAYNLKRLSGAQVNVLTFSAFIDSGLSYENSTADDELYLHLTPDEEIAEAIKPIESAVGLQWDLDKHAPVKLHISGVVDRERPKGDEDNLDFIFVPEGSTLADTLVYGRFYEDIEIKESNEYIVIQYSEVADDEAATFQNTYIQLMTITLDTKVYTVFCSNSNDTKRLKL